MADTGLRKMSRGDLIEVIYRYQNRELQLTDRVETLARQLEDRQLQISSSGSLAEAALRLNGVFSAAQAAADQYLYSIRGRNRQLRDRGLALLDTADRQLEAAAEAWREVPSALPGDGEEPRCPVAAADALRHCRETLRELDGVLRALCQEEAGTDE